MTPTRKTDDQECVIRLTRRQLTLLERLFNDMTDLIVVGDPKVAREFGNVRRRLREADVPSSGRILQERRKKGRCVRCGGQKNVAGQCATCMQGQQS